MLEQKSLTIWIRNVICPRDKKWHLIFVKRRKRYMISMKGKEKVQKVDESGKRRKESEKWKNNPLNRNRMTALTQEWGRNQEKRRSSDRNQRVKVYGSVGWKSTKCVENGEEVKNKVKLLKKATNWKKKSESIKLSKMIKESKKRSTNWKSCEAILLFLSIS